MVQDGHTSCPCLLAVLPQRAKVLHSPSRAPTAAAKLLHHRVDHITVLHGAEAFERLVTQPARGHQQQRQSTGGVSDAACTLLTSLPPTPLPKKSAPPCHGLRASPAAAVEEASQSPLFMGRQIGHTPKATSTTMPARPLALHLLAHQPITLACCPAVQRVPLQACTAGICAQFSQTGLHCTLPTSLHCTPRKVETHWEAPHLRAQPVLVEHKAHEVLVQARLLAVGIEDLQGRSGAQCCGAQRDAVLQGWTPRLPRAGNAACHMGFCEQPAQAHVLVVAANPEPACLLERRVAFDLQGHAAQRAECMSQAIAGDCAGAVAATCRRQHTAHACLPLLRTAARPTLKVSSLPSCERTLICSTWPSAIALVCGHAAPC